MASRLLHVLRSKTVWTAVLFAGFTTFNQDMQRWISGHPGHVGKVVCFAMLALRALTFGPLIPRSKNDDTGRPDIRSD